jgi:hypothetical protein
MRLGFGFGFGFAFGFGFGDSRRRGRLGFLGLGFVVGSYLNELEPPCLGPYCSSCFLLAVAGFAPPPAPAPPPPSARARAAPGAPPPAASHLRCALGGHIPDDILRCAQEVNGNAGKPSSL